MSEPVRVRTDEEIRAMTHDAAHHVGIDVEWLDFCLENDLAEDDDA